MAILYVWQACQNYSLYVDSLFGGELSGKPPLAFGELDIACSSVT
jgi:hypothetical protein